MGDVEENMEQKYTWAQIAGQVSTVMSQYTAMQAMLDMMTQAAQVEAYLAAHENVMAVQVQQLEAAREDLRAIAQEYADLQEISKADEKAHRARMHTLRKREADKEKDVAGAIVLAEQEYDRLKHESDQRLIVHGQECQALMNEMQEELDAKETKLTEVNTALAKLRENL